MPDDKDQQTGLGTKLRAVMPWIFALIILVAYSLFLKYLLGKTQVEDNEWMKLTYIFGSLEAIVFTAVGFIFGREVNRSRAVTAEKDADKAKKDKKKLAKEILDKIPSPPPTPPPAGTTPGLSGLRSMAEEFYAD